jgi:hypothetical protein
MKWRVFVAFTLCGVPSVCWWLISPRTNPHVTLASENAVKLECDSDYIGTLQMEEDRTVKAFLTACDPGKAIGHAMMVYRPNDPGYVPILDRVGGLSPGESKPIPAYKRETN